MMEINNCDVDESEEIDESDYELSINGVGFKIKDYDDFEKILDWFLLGDKSKLPELLEMLERK